MFVIFLPCDAILARYMLSSCVCPLVCLFVCHMPTQQQSRPNKAGLKWPSVHSYLHTYIRPSTKSFVDFNEIWRVGRGQWVVHDGMQYDPIQGQGHDPFKVEIPAILKKLSFPPFTVAALATDHWFFN